MLDNSLLQTSHPGTSAELPAILGRTGVGILQGKRPRFKFEGLKTFPTQKIRNGDDSPGAALNPPPRSRNLCGTYGTCWITAASHGHQE